jgi:exosome complex exonuclease RRP6
MFFYARSDTHFLLYIYDNMRNELIDRTKLDDPGENRIEQVLQKSKETALLRHECQVYNKENGKGPGGWYSLLFKTPALLNNEQFAVYRATHEWRDKIARADDDSTAFVMPNHVIMSIAKLMPTDMVALLGIAHPVSYSVKSRSGELLEVIKSAKARGKDGPSMMDVLRPDTVGAVVKANVPSVASQTPSKTLVSVVDEGQLRSESSSFWGGAFGSSIWDVPTAVKTDDELRLAVPLPQLSSEIFAVSYGLADRSRALTETPVQPVQASKQMQKEEDEAFVIKRGAKRKSDAISEAGDSTGEYDISLNDEVEQAARDKAMQKAEKRAKKKLKRAQRKLAEAAATGDNLADLDDEEPFDYSKAESVLHGNRNNGEQGGSKRKKPFDPYVKSADAPKGMRRSQTERAGKSHTFKS